MNIDDLTIKQARDIARMFCDSGDNTPTLPQNANTDIPVGKNVLIRGVTLYYVGHCVRVTEQEIVLSDASWVAHTGRFNEALTTGVLSEVEPFPHGNVVVGRGAVMDVSAWPHDLPRTVK